MAESVGGIVEKGGFVIFKLKCKSCGSTCWVQGDIESDTGDLNLDEKSAYEWEPENSICEHSDWDIIDQDDDPYEPDDY